MKKKNILILLLIVSLLSICSYLGWRVYDQYPPQDNKEYVQSKKIIDSLNIVIQHKDSIGRVLSQELDNLRKTEDSRVDSIKRLNPQSGITYLKSKLRENNNKNSALNIFYSNSDTSIIDTATLKEINATYEKSEILQSEVNILDSLVSNRNQIIEGKDSIISKYQEREALRDDYWKDQVKKEKRKKNIFKVTTGLGVIGIILLAL